MAQKGRLKRVTAERVGRMAEHWAAFWLMAKGYQIVKRRFKCAQGEVDLIIRKGRTIAFVEVKARATNELALFAVTPRNEKRIAGAAVAWLSRHPRMALGEIRYDIVTVVHGRPRHYRDAFRPEANQRSVNQGNLF